MSGNTCGVGGWGGPLPGDPSNNSILSATSAFGGIDVNWTYPMINPWAVAYVKLYRGLSADFNSAIFLLDTGASFYFDKLETGLQYYYWIRIVSKNTGSMGALIGPATAVAKPTIATMIEMLTGQIDAGVLATSLKTQLDRIDTLAGGLAGEVLDRQHGEVTLSQAMAQVNAGVAQTLTFLTNEQTSRIDGQSALADSINLIAVTSGANLAAVASTAHAEVLVVGNRISSLATHVDSVEAQAGQNLAQAQTQLQTNITTVDGHVTAIGALYTAKVTVNGLVGGFGVYNDGTTVDAGFDVDRFWVGRTNANKRKPFIIENDIVYMDEAAINHLTFTKLRDESGSFIVADGKLQATYIDTKGMVIRDALGNAIFGVGVNLDASRISAAPGWLNSNQTLGALGYTGSLNATSDINLVARGNCVVAGNTATKVGGTNAWNSDVYSKDSYTGGAYASFVVSTPSSHYMVGLNSDPTTDQNYTSLDYAWYVNGGSLLIFESNVNTVTGGFGTVSVGDLLTVIYDGVNVSYYHNGVLARTVAAVPGLTLFLDSSFNDPSASASNIRFGPMTSVAAVTSAASNALSTANTANSNAGSALDAANNALTSTNDKLSKSAASILSATVSLNAVAGAGFVAGTLTWDALGNYINGYGVAMTPGGIIGYNPSHQNTININAVTGEAFFGGVLKSGIASKGTTSASLNSSAAFATGTATTSISVGPITALTFNVVGAGDILLVCSLNVYLSTHTQTPYVTRIDILDGTTSLFDASTNPAPVVIDEVINTTYGGAIQPWVKSNQFGITILIPGGTLAIGSHTIKYSVNSSFYTNVGVANNISGSNLSCHGQMHVREFLA